MTFNRLLQFVKKGVAYMNPSTKGEYNLLIATEGGYILITKPVLIG
jgi:hypothetical protein